MKISYDAEIDALYIRLLDGEHECRTLRLNESISLNIGKDEMLVGIEILDARDVLGAGAPPILTLENITLLQPVLAAAGRTGPAPTSSSL